MATNPNQSRSQTTGWFFCSTPEASIASIVINSIPLTAIATPTITDESPYSSISLAITNASEGSYRLHVKTVDTARNESLIDTAEVLLDLTRPTFQSPAYTRVAALGINSSTNTHLANYEFQCASRQHIDWVPQVDEDIEVSDTKILQHYSAGANLKLTLNCSSTANIYDDMNAAHTQWLSDGPKTAEFMACDECSASPERASEIWYLDVDPAMVPSGIGLGSAPRSFSYGAGINHLNPYVLSHNVLNMPVAPSGAASLAATTYHVYNGYINRTHQNQLLAPNSTTLLPFPVQTEVDDCTPYGRYSYEWSDGCNRRSTQDFSYTVPGPGTCGSGKTKFCPNFTNGTAPGSCASLGLTDCVTEVSGGYCGTGAISSCQFQPSIHRSCYMPNCQLTNFRDAPGGLRTLSVGESLNNVNLGYEYEAFIDPPGILQCTCRSANLTCVIGNTGTTEVVELINFVGAGACSGGYVKLIAGSNQGWCVDFIDPSTPASQLSTCLTQPGICEPTPSTPECSDSSLNTCAGCSDLSGPPANPNTCHDIDVRSPQRVCCEPPPVTPPPTCNAASTWEWPAASCAATHSCTSGQTPTTEQQSQTCPTNDCCGSATTRTCYTGCTSSPTCSFGGNTFAVGAGVESYTTSSVPCGSTCTLQSSECTASGWAPPTGEQTCSVNACPGCTITWSNGSTSPVPHGGSVTAYQNGQGTCTTPCASEERSCNNGVLSGTFNHASCTNGCGVWEFDSYEETDNCSGSVYLPPPGTPCDTSVPHTGMFCAAISNLNPSECGNCQLWTCEVTSP